MKFESWREVPTRSCVNLAKRKFLSPRAVASVRYERAGRKANSTQREHPQQQKRRGDTRDSHTNTNEEWHQQTEGDGDCWVLWCPDSILISVFTCFSFEYCLLHYSLSGTHCFRFANKHRRRIRQTNKSHGTWLCRNEEYLYPLNTI